MTTTVKRMLAASCLAAGLISLTSTGWTQSAMGTAHTQAVPREAQEDASSAGTRDAEFARRGFIATRNDPKVRNAQGRVVYDLAALDFLKGAVPESVNPSLWRHQQLLALNGLFQVSERIWQVRGFDAANTTFIKGDHGWIVIDTLSSIETAKAAFDLVTERLGNRPIVAIVYTHPHSDHFGGAAGLVSPQEVRSGQVQIVAPKGFLEAAIRENVITGPAVLRRSAYQFGFTLPPSPTGQVGIGIGPEGSSGTPSLIPPTRKLTIPAKVSRWTAWRWSSN